jgi:hypothetical protein
MKCKHCGHETKKQTFYDMLKLFFEGGIDVEGWSELTCNKNCPFRKICKFPEHGICYINEFEAWLRKEVPCQKKQTK